MSIGLDGRVIEDRRPTPIGNTDSVPRGTLVTVPSVPPSGGTGQAPVVAVNTRHWYNDPAFLASAGGAFLALADPIVEALTTDGPIRWRSFIAACVLALVAYLRKRSNTVLK